MTILCVSSLSVFTCDSAAFVLHDRSDSYFFLRMRDGSANRRLSATPAYMGLQKGFTVCHMTFIPISKCCPEFIRP